MPLSTRLGLENESVEMPVISDVPEAFGRAEHPLEIPARKKSNPDQSENGNGHKHKAVDNKPKESESKEPEKPPLYKRPIPMLILGIVLLLLIVASVIWWLIARQYESTDDAFIDGHVIQMCPQVAAYVAKVHFDDNWLVKANDLLIELDPRNYQVVVDQKKADLASSQDKLIQTQTQLLSANAEIAQDQAELVVAQVNALNSTRDYLRYNGLNTEARSQQQMDNATAAKKSADAQVAAAQAKLASGYADLAQTRAMLKVAQAAIVESQADLDQAQINLNYCKIYAPESGRITQKNVEPGDYVTVGQPLFAIVPTNVWVTANFKETQLDLIRSGQPVDIRVDAYPDHKFHGWVDSIQNGSGSKFTLLPPENATGNYVKIVQRVPVKIFFDPGETARLDFLLAPGISVVPSIKVR